MLTFVRGVSDVVLVFVCLGCVGYNVVCVGGHGLGS